MQALLYYGQRDIRLEEVPVPQPGPAEVRIRVTDAGICQTQINEFIEGPYIINRTPHPRTGLAIPLIVGHEFGGIVDAVGNEDLHASLLGQQVAVVPLLPCGECSYCRHGQENLCDSIAYHGLVGAHGGFAEYACVQTQNLVTVQDRGLLTFIEPILVAINAGRKVQTQLSDGKVIVVGCGAIGLAIQAVFRDYFHADVVATESLPQRRARAQAAGFTVYSPEAIDEQFDLVVDCAGSNPVSTDTVLIEWLARLRKGGTLLSVGTYFHPISFIPSNLLVAEQQIVPSYMFNRFDLACLPAVLQALHVDFSSLIDSVPLQRIITDGYYRAEVDKDSFTRLVVKC